MISLKLPNFLFYLTHSLIRKLWIFPYGKLRKIAKSLFKTKISQFYGVLRIEKSTITVLGDEWMYG